VSHCRIKTGTSLQSPCMPLIPLSSHLPLDLVSRLSHSVFLTVAAVDRHSSVDITTKLSDERPRNRSSILDTGNIFSIPRSLNCYAAHSTIGYHGRGVLTSGVR
jgi:hypothetical protein